MKIRVKKVFLDKIDNQTWHEVGKEIDNFDDERCQDLISRGLAEEIVKEDKKKAAEEVVKNDEASSKDEVTQKDENTSKNTENEASSKDEEKSDSKNK